MIIFLSGCNGEIIQTEEIETELGFRDVLVIDDITTIPNSPIISDINVELSFIIENKDTEKKAEGVTVELFDAPFFKNKNGELCNSATNACKPDECDVGDPCTIFPHGKKQISFSLKAPSADELGMLETDVALQLRVNYEFEGSLLYTTKVIDMEEIKTRQRAGESETLVISKDLGSGPIQIYVEVLGAPYIISGSSGTLLFTVKDMGTNGFLKNSKILENKLTVEFPEGVGTIEADGFKCKGGYNCENSDEIELFGGESATLYFRILDVELAEGIPYQSFPVKVNVPYTYELRDSIDVKIKPHF